MSEPHIIEEDPGKHEFAVRNPSEIEAGEHAILEYEKEIEDLRKGLEAIAGSAGTVMSARKREMLVGMLDELQDQLQEADARVETAVPRARIPATSRWRKELVDEITSLRSVLLKKRVELTIARATEHAPAVANAVLASFRK